MRALLTTLAQVESILEAEDGKKAVSLVAESRPDVVLLAVRMPELDGLETTGIIKSIPHSRGEITKEQFEGMKRDLEL